MPLDALFSHHFLLMALLTAFAASIAGGVMGSYIVAKRIVFLSGSISHAVLGGMGFFLFLERIFGFSWAHPIGGALLAALICALLLGWIRTRYKEREDTLIAVLWSTGMAIGVILIALTPGYNVELTNFLFGNILWSTPSDIALLLGLDVVIVVLVAIFHRRFLAICFDEEQALIQGVPVQTLYILLLCLVAVSIVLLIQIVGAILVVSMLAIPPAMASLFSQRLSKIMILSIILGCSFSFIGTGFSYDFNWPPGATIALTAAAIYLTVLPWKKRA